MLTSKRVYKGVHDAHCCPVHGCKYGDDYCSVVEGFERGIKDEGCEFCHEDSQNPDKIRIKELEAELALVRRAARLIHRRRWAVSGSLEMANIDAVCKEGGLEVWKWPARG